MVVSVNRRPCESRAFYSVESRVMVVPLGRVCTWVILYSAVKGELAWCADPLVVPRVRLRAIWAEAGRAKPATAMKANAIADALQVVVRIRHAPVRTV